MPWLRLQFLTWLRQAVQSHMQVFEHQEKSLFSTRLSSEWISSQASQFLLALFFRNLE